MPTATPFQLVSSSILSSDYLASNEVLADATSATPVSVFRNPARGGAVEALVITSALGNDSQVCYLSQSADASTGWQLAATASWTVTASEVVAFGTTWNTVEAYFIGLDGTLYHMVMDTGGTTWGEPQAVDGAPSGMNHLGLSYQPGATTTNQRMSLVTAVTTDMQLFMAWSQDGNWSTDTTTSPALSSGFDSLAVAAPFSTSDRLRRHLGGYQLGDG